MSHEGARLTSPVFTPPSSTKRRSARKLEPTEVVSASPSQAGRVVVRTLFGSSAQPSPNRATTETPFVAVDRLGAMYCNGTEPVAETRLRLRVQPPRRAVVAAGSRPSGFTSGATIPRSGAATLPRPQELIAPHTALGLDTRSAAWPWPRGINTGYHSLESRLIIAVVRLLSERDAVRIAGTCAAW
eukprot:SAG11_NODE_517_length_8815_cov_35.866797_10_plen_186_part_00